MEYILRKKRSIRRELKAAIQQCSLNNEHIVSIKIAILGGSTTSEIKDLLELFLLQEGIEPAFYESEYNKYYEDVMFDNEELRRFAPHIIYVHTTNRNILSYPDVTDSPKTVENKFSMALQLYESLWRKIEQTYQSIIIQNNFELPSHRLLGNLDCYDCRGAVYFISRLNSAFADYAARARNFYINDINYLSSWIGLNKWHDKSFWYAYKYALSYEAILCLSHNIAAIILSIYGKSKKCLVVDLDNTLWGGVIADDGINHIQIGTETAEAEAYTEFQEYLRKLKARGVLLAVCSKNDEHVAREGLNHRDGILRPDDFVVIKANWQPKDTNICEIVKEINITLDSVVFLDDNPIERDFVRSQLPVVEVPDTLMNDVSRYIECIDRACYFEPVTLSEDDIRRTEFYQETQQRCTLQSKFATYNDFLISLEMVVEIHPFKPLYLERIAQLINKTNQFNLTTKRYTLAEVEGISKDENFITLYGRLKDKFGDNGLVSIIVASIKDRGLFIDLWLMSCRVLKRGMEFAMYDELIRRCRMRDIKHITGYYNKTKKNALVSNHYGLMGFELSDKNDNGDTVWSFKVPDDYRNKNCVMEIVYDREG
ncbi:MAG: HAD-IIIC family phosphatase [Nitrospirae bacterium]|nr:HAD-IIIC family phosphatase [Nitrospirota bacterium]